MARPRDLFARLRPAGTPGAAAGRGVPADRVAEQEAELLPVIGRLQATLDRAEELRREGELEAERARAQVETRVRSLEGEARTRAEAERAQAAADVRRQTAAEVARVLSEAEERASSLRRERAAGLSQEVDRVLDAVRERMRAEVSSGPVPMSRPPPGEEQS